MNCKNNTKIILLLSIGLLLILGCHKSATAENISLTAEDVVLNDPFLTTLFYSKETIITSDVLQKIINKEQEGHDATPTNCRNIIESRAKYGSELLSSNQLEKFMVDWAIATHAGFGILLINNCLPRDRINFPIINGLLYFWGDSFSAIATLEDYIKNKQVIRETYLENENTNVKLDMILVTGKVESKGYVLRQIKCHGTRHLKCLFVST